MASNLEIYALRMNEDLLKRIETAVTRLATYLRGLGDNANPEQQQWAAVVLENGRSAAIAQACAWEVVFNPIIGDAVDVSGVPDTGEGSLQVAVEVCCLNYKG